MVSSSNNTFARSFAVDRIAVQETARRQFVLSAVLVVGALTFAAMGGFRATISPSYKSLEAAQKVGDMASPIRAQVRYVDRNGSEHRVSVASSDDRGARASE